MPAPGPPVSSLLVSPVLVGRDDLVQLAERRIDEARRGRGGMLFLAGDAGIGKTRLLGTIERAAAAAGFRVARGGTYPGDLEVAAAVLIDLARAMTQTASLEAAGQELSARLASESVDAVSASTGDAHRRRRILVLDLASLLAEVVTAVPAGHAGESATAPTRLGPTTPAPALLSLEDLHQADDLTLEVLAALATRLPELRLLVVGTYRSDELYPRIPMRQWRSLLLTRRLAEEARLARLTIDQTATLAAALLPGSGPLPTATAEAIHRRTDGIPLHVEELIGLLAATGGSLDDAIDSDAVPDTVEDAILGRLDRISAPARRLAEVGAVIGRSFELELLQATIGGDADDLSAPLAELADHFILAQSGISGRFGFRHALICDAIYGRLPAPRRRRLHRQVAGEAAARGDFSEAFLSLQYERAGLRDEAFRAALHAAEAATRISSNREALELYRRALRTAPRDLDPAERGRIERASGLAASACDDNELAAERLESARADFLAAGQTLDAAVVIPPLVAVRHLLGEGLEARAARLETAQAELAALPATPERDAALAQVLAGLSAAYMLDRRLEPSITFGEEARAVATACGDDATERHASVTVGACLVFAGQMDAGWDLLEEAIEASRAAQLEAEAARGYRMIGSSASVLVEYGRAEHWLREGIDYAERVELWNHRHYMAAHLAHVLWATGRWTEAASIAERALADGRGGITTRITALHVLGYLAFGRGEPAVARAALDEARQLGEAMRELQRLSPALWGLAEAAVLDGDAATAVRWCEAGREASVAVDDAAYLFPFLVTGVRAHLLAQDPGAAAAWAGEIAERLRRRGIPGTSPAIAHADGLVALARGSTGAARERLAEAVDAWSSARRVWEGIGARIDLAECELRSRRLAAAARLAGEARDLAAALPSAPLVRRAEQALSRTRARHAGDAPWSPLTARELEVARLVSSGETNVAIAASLGLSPKTVAAHVEHILAKLGASRRAEIAAWVAGLDGGAARRS